ncbi:MAG: hypothetical protein AABO57_18110 [Acidobacteriota bacterium]
MSKMADVYAQEIMDEVMEAQPANKQERDEVKHHVRGKIVESWQQVRRAERRRTCETIKQALNALRRTDQNGTEMIELNEALRLVEDLLAKGGQMS